MNSQIRGSPSKPRASEPTSTSLSAPGANRQHIIHHGRREPKEDPVDAEVYPIASLDYEVAGARRVQQGRGIAHVS